MIANPSSSLNTALRGGAAAAQPLSASPAARPGPTSPPASNEFSRMLEHNQTAARQTQAAIQARQVAQGAGNRAADQTSQPASSAPASAAAPEQATASQDPSEAQASESASVPGDAARSARSPSARDKASPARTARADAAEPADAKASPENVIESEDATALVFAATPGQPVLPAAAAMGLATVTPGDTAAAGDAAVASQAIDAALAGVAGGKPGPRDASSGVRPEAAKAVRSEATAGTAAAVVSDAQTDLREAANAAHADALPSGPAVPAAAKGSAAPVDPSLVAMNGAAGRDVSMPLPGARELSERTAHAPEATPDAALAALARSALSEPAHRTAAAGDAASPAAFGIALANVQAARAGDVSTPAVAQASVATPLTDPGFQQALGYQVSLLARDGIGQAELHLNPTDMGPVSVQITMTGDQARVDFGADLAQTRQLLEAGWAELASSLKDAGFTLSGGGVSDHARERQAQQGQGAAQSFGGRVARDSGELPAVAPVAARRVAGGVDVYA